MRWPRGRILTGGRNSRAISAAAPATCRSSKPPSGRRPRRTGSRRGSQTTPGSTKECGCGGSRSTSAANRTAARCGCRARPRSPRLSRSVGSPNRGSWRAPPTWAFSGTRASSGRGTGSTSHGSRRSRGSRSRSRRRAGRWSPDRWPRGLIVSRSAARSAPSSYRSSRPSVGRRSATWARSAATLSTVRRSPTRCRCCSPWRRCSNSPRPRARGRCRSTSSTRATSNSTSRLTNCS